MESILNTIKDGKLISAGEVIGVALSGGEDSMALLNYLASIQDELDFEVVAIHVDHNIRETSGDDANFVISYCRGRGIRAYKFKVDAPKIAKTKNISLEMAAREARYGVFNAVIEKGIVDKIAIAHHMSDQAETILLRLFRGSGVSGAKGMETKRGGVYIRPMLNTSKKEIRAYMFEHDIPYVQDETNFDDAYSRNYIRNQIMPMIEKNWPSVVSSLVTFGKACADDDEYINSQIYDDALILFDKTVKIPTSYFLYPNAIVSRLVLKAMKKIGVEQDVERKHIELVKDLAKNGENGKRISLPFSVVAYKEYDYVTIVNKFIPKPEGVWELKCGELDIEGFGKIVVRRAKDLVRREGELVLDYKKLPKDVVWRFRKEGDVFEKFGGGQIKLKKYLIDKKVPQRLRDNLPLLANDQEVFAIAGLDISEKVRVDDTSSGIYKITVVNN